MKDLSRWKLVLGQDADSNNEVLLNNEQIEVDQLLQAIYGDGGSGSLGRSAPKIKKWLDGIRLNFPSEVVQIIQADALERQGLKEMLLEPELLEKLEPSVSLVALILQLQHLVPEKSKAVARLLVERLVREIEKKLINKLQFAVQKATRQHSRPTAPSNSNIDWNKTVYKNLKNYRPEIKSIIPDRWFGFKKGYSLPQVFIVVDKSESMIHSMIFASIMASILAKLKSIQSHLIFFDTEISDVSNKFNDPIDILFSTPCGGGTDIALAMQYVKQQIINPKRSLIFLISDLYEGGNKSDLLYLCKSIKDQGTSLLCLLNLDDEGTADFDHHLASLMAALDIPCFACPPEKFPDLISEHLNSN